jgi:hypothetical protein
MGFGALRAIDAPPVGAGPLRVKVSVAVAPEARVAGLMLKALSDTVVVAGVTETDADVVLPP